MRTIALAGLIVGMLVGTVSQAGAAACAAGPYRAGCAGPHGAVVTHRHPYGYHGATVVRPVHPHCYWRGGVRVCR